MEEMENKEAPEQEFVMPKRRERKPRFKLEIRLPGFLANIGADVRWYYDIRLWSPLLLLLFVLALLPSNRTVEAVDVPEEQISVTETTEPEETEPPTEAPVNEDAEALARLADTVGYGRSNNVKTIIMWVAINRSEDRSNGYGRPLLEEIDRPNQWQGYDEEAEYSQSTYDIALEVLSTKQKGGLRPLDNDMLWFVLNHDGSITLRNRFSAGNGQQWREKTVY